MKLQSLLKITWQNRAYFMATQPPGDADSDADKNEAETDDRAAMPTEYREEIARWLEQLQRSDRSLYNLMALEVWSIAHTMDDLIPGFWHRFMVNRQIALQEFLAQRQAQQDRLSDEAAPSANEDGDGMMEGEDEKFTP
jgi:hypothetical protein